MSVSCRLHCTPAYFLLKKKCGYLSDSEHLDYPKVFLSINKRLTLIEVIKSPPKSAIGYISADGSKVAPVESSHTISFVNEQSDIKCCPKFGFCWVYCHSEGA